MSGAVIVQGRYESSPSAVANGQHRDIQISATGVVVVSSTPSSVGTGLSFGSTANIVRIAPTASNGATVVQLVAASGATIVYPKPFFKSKYYWVLGLRQAWCWGYRYPSSFPATLRKLFFDGRGDVRTAAGERLAFIPKPGLALLL